MDFRIIKNKTIRRIKMKMMRHMFATQSIGDCRYGMTQYTDFFSLGQCPGSAHPGRQPFHARLPDGCSSC
jgi:hypothetical protein